jgi:hypothetical protein
MMPGSPAGRDGPFRDPSTGAIGDVIVSANDIGQ